MPDETIYPTRDAACWPPAAGFTKIDAGKNWRGVPDGVHTGGAYLSPDGKEVWKPLVGLWPTMNGFCAAPTEEDTALKVGAGLKSFPDNWRVEEAAGKRWLVRPRCIVLNTPELARQHMDLEHILQIEQDVRELNRRGWAIHDDLSVARGRRGCFVLDLSNAHSCKIGWNDDTDHLLRWLEHGIDMPWLHYIRHVGRYGLHVFDDRIEAQIPDWETRRYLLNGKAHFYASRSRPMDAMWGPRDWIYIRGTAEDYQQAQVHTWVLTDEPIPPEKVYRYELTWAWSPL